MLIDKSNEYYDKRKEDAVNNDEIINWANKNRDRVIDFMLSNRRAMIETLIFDTASDLFYESADTLLRLEIEANQEAIATKIKEQ